MNLGLDTIASLGAKGNSKSAVLEALFATKARNSVLGTYGFDKNGDTTLKSYGLYKVGSDGSPVFFKTVTPSRPDRRSVGSCIGEGRGFEQRIRRPPRYFATEQWKPVAHAVDCRRLRRSPLAAVRRLTGAGA